MGDPAAASLTANFCIQGDSRFTGAFEEDPDEEKKTSREDSRRGRGARKSRRQKDSVLAASLRSVSNVEAMKALARRVTLAESAESA